MFIIRTSTFLFVIPGLRISLLSSYLDRFDGVSSEDVRREEGPDKKNLIVIIILDFFVSPNSGKQQSIKFVETLVVIYIFDETALVK